MIDYLIYLVKVSACFAVLYTLFYVGLRKLTFHKVNRVLLLLILPLSFVIPISNELTSSVVSVSNMELGDFKDLVVDTEYVEYVDTYLNINTESNTSPLPYFIALYWIGFAVSMLRLLLSILKLYFLKQKSTSVLKEGYLLVLADVPSIFSYFNWIFIPKNKVDSYAKPILEHEKAHSKLAHTLDLLLIEIYISICWFNPFAYFFRKSIKSIHEFQADEAVLKNKIKKSFYLKLLLDNFKTEHFLTLHSHFNYPIIKNRIDMITKTNSNKRNVLKYFLLVPIIAILSMSFTKIDDKSSISIDVKTPEVSKFETNKLPSIFPVKNASKDDITATFGKDFKHPISKKMINHGGIDIRTTKGAPVFATADGVASKAKSEGNWGNLIIISHANGYKTWYAHLDGFKITKNQQVKKGDIIGYVGNTGQSTGSHLHYEVRVNDKRVNPMDYFLK
jgi:murein DD-endopeptidase MepM/ murein hydrolase activator NlpD